MTARNRFAALLATAVAVAVLAGCGDEENPSVSDPEPADPTSSQVSEPPPSSAPPSADDSGSAGPGTVAVPLYFVGDTPLGPRLFREFRNVEADNPLAEAVALVVAGDAQDPDYGTGFPEGRFASVSDEGDAIVVTVTDDAWSAAVPGMTSKQAKLAVQQLVYTAQGVVQAEKPVRVVNAAGEAVPLFGADSGAGLVRADQNDVLALVNITDPAEGATVSGTTTASGVANSFEATVPWEVRDQSGTKVLDGFATAEGWGDKLYPWQAPVDLSGLAPGTYTFVALTDDPSDGEGAGPTEDTRTIIVG